MTRTSKKQNISVTPQEASLLQIFRELNVNEEDFASVLNQNVAPNIIRLIHSYLEHYKKGRFISLDFYERPSSDNSNIIAKIDQSKKVSLTFGSKCSDNIDDNNVTWEDISFDGEWEDLLPNVELLTSAEVADLLGVNRECVESLVDDGRLLVLGKNSRSEERFPAEQFIDGNTIAGLSNIIAAFEQPELTWKFLSTPMFLDSETTRPIDVLKNGSEEEINTLVKTAHRFPVEFS